MNWFEDLTGFKEESPEQVRSLMTVDGERLRSEVNGREFQCGTLEIPSLAEITALVEKLPKGDGKLRLREVVADVQSLHADKQNAGAVFQVASQFNLLEMASPGVTPEDGVGIYGYDKTQGPACAIACGAGTIYRNYFVEIDRQTGQTADRQIDCLADLGTELGNTDNRLWQMQNGYAFATKNGLDEIDARIRSADEAELNRLRGLLRIGLQKDTAVTIADKMHTVMQVYGSALPVAYSPHPRELWKPFARFILEASYEATFGAAVLNAARTGNNKLFLTLLGGGVFGNEIDWIMAAIERAANIYSAFGLDVAIVSYGWSKNEVRELVERF